MTLRCIQCHSCVSRGDFLACSSGEKGTKHPGGSREIPASTQSSGGGVYSGSVSYKVIHCLALAGRKSHWQPKPPYIRHKHVCTRTHTDVYIQRDSPPHTYRYPAAPQHINAHDRQGATCGWRCMGTHSHTTTRCETQSRPRPPNTQEHTKPTNTCTQ
jgi:hypothetical protein